MRFLYSFTALACLTGAASLFAQNQFAGILVEPRPSEYIHWDAEAFAELQSGLEQDLRDGSRIWGTLFTYTDALPQADYRSHNVQIIHRSGYTQPEIHANKWDIYVILDGSGTAYIGGERVNWIDDGRPPEEQRPQLEGAQEFQVTEGDMLHVPARVWHQMLTETGESITYALINVIR
ncbi:MAG TPA: cupin domain-containing protein [Gammaproteobacteria bacterium]|jgi:mannose-6-phosphate isomerase-like protein (cupin superfamily)|nr:cupin domain-containing protein [Gammaproteobacteria bacterium]